LIFVNKKIAIALAVLIAILSVTPLFASTASFRDVPSTHFAFEAINWVSNPTNGAFMVGDAGNNFNPDRHPTKFDAAQIYAMAAGFRHVTTNLPPAEREVFTRSLETWRSFLDNMAAEFSTWNRSVDREIAFLLYRGILTTSEVQGFVTRTGTTETRPLLTREEAVTWAVRLAGQATQAQAVVIPPANPFSDNAQISQNYRRYIYHARDLQIISAASPFNPTAHLTRGELARILFNALTENTPTATNVTGTGSPSTVTGVIANVILDTHVAITSATRTETFAIAPNAVIMIDNTQRTPAFLREGMAVTVLLDGSRRVISLVARTAQTASSTPSTTTTPQSSHSDEGFVTAINATGVRTITIRTQRVRISGQIMDEERVFALAPNATITSGGKPSSFEEIKVGDIAFFGFNENVINTLELMERERTLNGALIEVRPPDNFGAMPVLIIEEADGRAYELRALPSTEFSRGNVKNLSWDDIRIGDKITAEVELDRLVRVHAVGERSTAVGRLNEIRITERNTEITMLLQNGSAASYIIRAGIFDVYTLRIGMQLDIALDSREVTNIIVQGGQNQTTVILGFIQSIRPDGTITIAEGQGATARTHNLTVPNNTTITRGGAHQNFQALRANMNVYIVLTAPGATTTASITVLP
jgi:hypothetical protein